MAKTDRDAEADYQTMVDRFSEYHDCNIAENDLWESVIEKYAK